jgi:DHA1 family bicyclomycin/chloramphenicol resistance-like MFS transporter
MSETARFTWLIPGLGFLSCLGAFSNDVFVPSLSLVAQGLGVDSGSAQLTMTALLVGFSLGSLIHGPLSDRFGRKPILCYGLAGYAIGGLLAANAESLGGLVAARTLQGVSISASMVLTRAIVLDRWTGTQASRVLSWLAIFMFFAPVLAPLIGGFVASFGYWPAVFWLQSGVGVVALALTAVFLSRTHSRRGTSILAGIRIYATVLSSGNALGYMLCTGCAFVGVIVFASTSSIVFVDYYGLSPIIQGTCFSVVMLGAAIGSFLNGRFVIRRGISAMLGLGTSFLATGGVAVLAACLADAHPALLVAAMMVFVFGFGFVFANAVARVMTHYRDNAAAVSAVFSLTQFIFGALITAGISTISTPGLLPLGISLCAAGVIAAVLWWGWLRNTEFTRVASGNAA